MILIIIFSAIAGIAGTGLGGFFSVLMLKFSTRNMTCWMLSIAAGVMTSIVCFGLIPETIELSGMAVCIMGLVLGILIIMILNHLIDRITNMKGEDLKIHHTPEELYHEGRIINDQFVSDKSKMLRSGILMLLAIGLHNIPEGIAIGAGGSHDFQLGMLLAIMIALHNIPEGMAIAAPLLAGGIGRGKVIFLTMLAGATTLLGGFAGIIVGSISGFTIAISLSAAGGAMLYIVFGEIIPQSIVMTKTRSASAATLAGIIIGLIITQI